MQKTKWTVTSQSSPRKFHQMKFVSNNRSFFSTKKKRTTTTLTKSKLTQSQFIIAKKTLVKKMENLSIIDAPYMYYSKLIQYLITIHLPIL